MNSIDERLARLKHATRMAVTRQDTPSFWGPALAGTPLPLLQPPQIPGNAASPTRVRRVTARLIAPPPGTLHEPATARQFAPQAPPSSGPAVHAPPMWQPDPTTQHAQAPLVDVIERQMITADSRAFSAMTADPFGDHADLLAAGLMENHPDPRPADPPSAAPADAAPRPLRAASFMETMALNAPPLQPELTVPHSPETPRAAVEPQAPPSPSEDAPDSLAPDLGPRAAHESRSLQPGARPVQVRSDRASEAPTDETGPALSAGPAPLPSSPPPRTSPGDRPAPADVSTDATRELSPVTSPSAAAPVTPPIPSEPVHAAPVAAESTATPPALSPPDPTPDAGTGAAAAEQVSADEPLQASRASQERERQELEALLRSGNNGIPVRLPRRPRPVAPRAPAPTPEPEAVKVAPPIPAEVSQNILARLNRFAELEAAGETDASVIPYRQLENWEDHHPERNVNPANPPAAPVATIPRQDVAPGAPAGTRVKARSRGQGREPAPASRTAPQDADEEPERGSSPSSTPAVHTDAPTPGQETGGLQGQNHPPRQEHLLVSPAITPTVHTDAPHPDREAGGTQRHNRPPHQASLRASPTSPPAVHTDGPTPGQEAGGFQRQSHPPRQEHLQATPAITPTPATVHPDAPTPDQEAGGTQGHSRPPRREHLQASPARTPEAPTDGPTPGYESGGIQAEAHPPRQEPPQVSAAVTLQPTASPALRAEADRVAGATLPGSRTARRTVPAAVIPVPLLLPGGRPARQLDTSLPEVMPRVSRRPDAPEQDVPAPAQRSPGAGQHTPSPANEAHGPMRAPDPGTEDEAPSEEQPVDAPAEHGPRLSSPVTVPTSRAPVQLPPDPMRRVPAQTPPFAVAAGHPRGDGTPKESFAPVPREHGMDALMNPSAQPPFSTSAMANGPVHLPASLTHPLPPSARLDRQSIQARIRSAVTPGPVPVSEAPPIRPSIPPLTPQPTAQPVLTTRPAPADTRVTAAPIDGPAPQVQSASQPAWRDQTWPDVDRVTSPALFPVPDESAGTILPEPSPTQSVPSHLTPVPPTPTPRWTDGTAAQVTRQPSWPESPPPQDAGWSSHPFSGRAWVPPTPFPTPDPAPSLRPVTARAPQVTGPIPHPPAATEPGPGASDVRAVDDVLPALQAPRAQVPVPLPATRRGRGRQARPVPAGEWEVPVSAEPQTSPDRSADHQTQAPDRPARPSPGPVVPQRRNPGAAPGAELIRAADPSPVNEPAVGEQRPHRTPHLRPAPVSAPPATGGLPSRPSTRPAPAARTSPDLFTPPPTGAEEAAPEATAPGPQPLLFPSRAAGSTTSRAAETAVAVRSGLQRALQRDGHGTPLSPDEQTHLKAVLGTSVADVRVIRRPEALPALQAAHADALTVGRTVFLPHDLPLNRPEGLALAAHEVTHARRATDPLFVPTVARHSVSATDEEGVALTTEHAAHQHMTRPEPLRRVPGIPAPWEPLAGWTADHAPGASFSAADRVDSGARPAPAQRPPVSAPPPPPGPAPQWHAAAADRPAPAPAPKAAARATDEAAVGRRAARTSPADLDDLAREVYARLREQLGQEWRRLN